VKSFRFNLDALGMCASSLCMVHCLVFPLLLAFLPMWSLAAPTEDVAKAEQCPADACCHSAESHAGAVASDSCCGTPVDYWIHVGLLGTVAPLGIVAWGMGYRQHHRLGVVGLGLFGVLLLCGALLFGHRLLDGRGEQIMTVLGSICMVSAHLWNRHQCRCCRSPDTSALVGIANMEPTLSGDVP